MTKRKWTKQKIIDELGKVSESIGGKTPKEKFFIEQGNYALYRAAKRHFGTYTNAVLTVGLKPNLQFWNVKFIGPNDIEKLLKQNKNKLLLRDLHLLKKGIDTKTLAKLDSFNEGV